MSNIVELGPHCRMTAEEAEEMVKREGHKEVLIIYYDEEGDVGIRSSGMQNKDALWLIEQARLEILLERVE